VNVWSQTVLTPVAQLQDSSALTSLLWTESILSQLTRTPETVRPLPIAFLLLFD
jgi:hypothetical protein